MLNVSWDHVDFDFRRASCCPAEEVFNETLRRSKFDDMALGLHVKFFEGDTTDFFILCNLKKSGLDSKYLPIDAK